MMPRKENAIEIKSGLYSDRIVKMYQYLTSHRHENILSKQILRSGTSIGANVAESFNAQSDADFVNKMNIALKEADESLYWLKKLRAGNFITEKEFASMETDNTEIIKLLTSIVKTKKKNMGLL
ncbi:MAG: four helix bundle protein [Prevotella sp.]|nr:four helix bundle protein [Prevotella sp.]